MDSKTLTEISQEWNEQIYAILDLEELSIHRLQLLLKDTYRALYTYYKDALIPKEICTIFSYMDEFLYFAEVMEENEKGIGFYNMEEMKYIIDALKNGFLTSEYKRAYPQLVITDIMHNEYLLNLETDNLVCYFKAVQEAKAEDC